MKLFFYAVRLNLKNIGLKRFLPVLFVDFLFPVMVTSSALSNTADRLQMEMQLFTQIFFPFMSVWSVICVGKEYSESDGRELLFTLGKIKDLSIYLFIFASGLINLTLVLFLSESVYPLVKQEIPIILSASVFMFGLTLLSLYILRSVALTFLINILYLTGNYILIGEEIKPFFYMSNIFPSGCDLIKTCSYLIVGGCALFFLFLLFRKKRI